MLDWPTLVKAHALVPAWYWPVLWHYLARLEATAELARAEGRGGFGWELLKTGVIRVTHWPESDAERAARGALPRSFEYSPWTRLDPDLAPAWPLPDPYTAETPPIHRGCTLHAPPGVYLVARAPPPPWSAHPGLDPGTREAESALKLPETPDQVRGDRLEI